MGLQTKAEKCRVEKAVRKRGLSRNAVRAETYRSGV